jgi:hypothetical protein
MTTHARKTEAAKTERPNLRLVASQIKPLPEEVSPSDRFRLRMRRRLLALKSSSNTRSAA